MIKGNTKFFGVSWASGGGGSLAVMNLEKTGRLSGTVPHLSGHTGTVLDFDFCPFNEYQVATGSDDCSIKVWQIPEGGLTETISEALVTLSGHQKKVHIVGYHPTADGVLTSASHDHTIKIWDISAGAMVNEIADVYKETIFSISWNKNGSAFCSTSKDKICRIVDPRGQSVVGTFEAHEGSKPQKCIWSNNLDKIITVGFSKQSDRQITLWDPRNLEAPLHSMNLDVAAGMYMPMLDEDNNVLYMGDKGGTSVKYFEVIDEAPYIFSLSAAAFSKPQKGICKLPKLAGDVMSCEVARILRLCGDYVEVVPMKVPRKASEFQADIFPETRAPVAAMTAEEWFGGKDADPVMMSAKPGEGIGQEPPKVMKTAFQLQKEADEKDALIEQLTARVAELEAKLS